MDQSNQQSRVMALAAGSGEAMREAAALKPFDGRVSDRVARALVRAGVDAPERLLFMAEADLAVLPGIGPAAQREIAAYRSRFIVGRP